MARAAVLSAYGGLVLPIVDSLLGCAPKHQVSTKPGQLQTASSR